MGRPREPVDEVIGRPRARALHLAFSHQSAGGQELVLVALDILAVDQVGNVQHHLAAFREPAAYFFIEGQKQPVHLKADCARARLPLPRAGRVLTQVAEVFPSHAFGWLKLFQGVGAAVIDQDLEVHLGLAAEFVNIAKELALVGPDRLAQALIVTKDSAEAEGKHR